MRSAEVEFEQMLLNRYSMEAYDHGPLDRTVYVLLSRIEAVGAMSIGELAEAVLRDTSTLNRQTAAAVKAGFLRRIADPIGGIARKFRLTEEGLVALQQQRHFVRSALDEVMADWSDEDILRFATYMRRLNSDIERDTGRVWPRRSTSAHMPADNADGTDPSH